MFSIDTRVRNLVTGALVTLFVAMPALADDTEIYQSQAAATGALPNVLFIMDTSGSMDTDVLTTVYDPNFKYDGSCSDDYIYYSVGNNGVPNCGTDQKFLRTANVCDASAAALVNIGGAGSWPLFGNPAARVAQFRSRFGNYEWRSIRNQSDYVDCQADEGVHGQTAASTAKWIWDDSASNNGWDTQSHGTWDGIGNTYRLYTANYVNYRNDPGTTTTTMTRLQIVRDVAISLASSLNNVNLGLMRYSTDAEGGYVLEPVQNIADNRDAMVKTLEGFGPDSGSGGTPLSETLYEAARYLKGDTWDYGSKSSPATSNAASVSGDTYISPIEHSCQKNYIVYLTDGAPTVDTSANGKIAAMIGKSACAADTAEPVHDNGWSEGSGVCLDDLAAWLSNPTTDLMPGTTVNGNDVTGNQNALTYMIGFGDSVVASVPYLNMVAAAGGTEKAYTAGDVPTLTTALQTIFSDIQEDSGTFVTPAITVNAFNRTQTDNDLYFSLFKAGKRTHWDGNLKKYRLDNDKIVDVNGKEAVTANGFFAPETTSIWSPTADGEIITEGGATSQLPAPDSRKIYTSIAGADLTAVGNAVTIDNSNITNAVVSGGADTTACSASASCQAAVNWARGKDVNDVDGDSDFDEQRKFMGDPLHGRPAVVTYGMTGGGEPDTVVYFPTNDGFLHAIQGTTSASGSGKELWSYIPPELMTRLSDLRSPTQTTVRTYGLDSDIVVLRLDVNQNGIVETGDRVWLFFGMRSGGNHYYGLDVTDRTQPKLMWNIGPDQLPGIGQTWSQPTIARVNVGGTVKNTDEERFVLIFGGGYDTNQETQTYSRDTRGNRIYMVEASTGTLLWYAGGVDDSATGYTGNIGTPDLVLDTAGQEMNNSIPSRVTVIDTTGDLFADRMYVGDMGGRVWRFDIYNGQPKDKLVTGGVIAKLGAGGIASPTAASNRRFYNTADVALINLRGQDPFYNIAIGSGYRGHPLDKTTEERFYAVRDPLPFSRLTQDQYDAIKPVLDGELVDITSSPSTVAVTKTDKGWKLSMTTDGVFKGQKVLAEAITADNIVLFTTFEPVDLASSKGACFPSSINRAYALTAFGGKPALDFNDDGKIDDKDIFVDVQQEGIVGEVNLAVLRKENEPPKSVCLTGLRLLKKCVDIGATVRTFWDRADAK